MLNLIRVLLSVTVHTQHTLALRCTSDARLCRVNIVVQAVKRTGNNHSGDSSRHDLDVVQLVDLSRTHRITMEGAHRPAERASLLAELGVETLLSFGYELLVVELLSLDRGKPSLLLFRG